MKTRNMEVMSKKNSNYKVHLDFETRSRINLELTGAWVYAGHPSTQVLCVAFSKDRDSIDLLPREELFDFGSQKIATLMEYAKDPKAIFHAHNAFFEYCVWHLIMVPRYGMPEIPITRWRCSAAKAAACGLPRALGSVAIELQLPVKKDTAGRALMLKLCKPKSDGNFIKSPESFKKLYEYCVNDVVVERDVDDALPDLSDQEQQIWFLDMYINQRGIQVDLPAIKTARRIASELEERLNKEVLEITDGRVDRITRHAAVKKYLGEIGLPLESVDKAHVKEALDAGFISDKARRILEIKQELGRSSLAKYDALERCCCEDMRVRDILRYHGAATGRWSGKFFQPQNLPSRGLGDIDAGEITEALHSGDTERIYKEPSVSAALSAAIRGVIIPSKGHKLICADYSAIEARVVMWLANDVRGMGMFASSDAGTDVEVYLQMARMLYGDDSITKEKDPVKRDLGKQTILGCGYQMGVDRFYNTCLGYGIDIPMSLAQKAVNFYRDKFYSVVRMWSAQEKAAMAAARGMKVRSGKVIWYRDDQWLICQLPSGRLMRYFRPEIRNGKLSYLTIDSTRGNFTRKDAYGGLLTENICQATARDILALAMLRVKNAGYEILFTVHDEIVAEHPNPDKKEFTQILTKETKWTAGLPLKADAWIGDRYRKG